MHKIYNCTFIYNAVRVLMGYLLLVCHQINAWYPISCTKCSSNQAGNNNNNLSVTDNCGCFYFNFQTQRGQKNTSHGAVPLHSLFNSTTMRSDNTLKPDYTELSEGFI